MLPLSYFFYAYIAYKLYESGVITNITISISKGYEMIEYYTVETLDSLETLEANETISFTSYFFDTIVRMLRITNLIEDEWVSYPKYYLDE
jgi:hypothetical protein